MPEIRTLLVANRGEIAVRIMRTARAMGLRTIAVYSDADRGAPHVRAADAALRIGGPLPIQSYLRMDAIVDAARAAGADAVHPGYGFLAENADFAQAVLDAGLVFVGPPPAAIRAMASKSEAKRLMRAAGVPCIEGFAGRDATDAELADAAARLGYPLMIKAAAGGGGRGMRLVRDAADFAGALRDARSEALHAFGEDEVLLERALVDPRHIEVQVFADAHGNVVHLGERDCSVQRRHQKLIEESPSPAVDAPLRARMGEVAVAAARAIGYRGAGTIEFLLGASGALDSGSFHFMEMNTRLQVEHAVTEAVAGVDLVEWQIRVARGEPLPLDQPSIDARLARGGHAIEVRVCAEDPSRDFLPQGGRVAKWRAPADVRVDHALEDGSAVPPYYDSMLAKIVSHAPTREAALARIVAAVDATVLLGVTTNRAFLGDCLRHPVFASGGATTGLIDAHLPAAARVAPGPNAIVLATAAALALRAAASARYPRELAGWSNGARPVRVVRMELDGAEVRVDAVLAAPLDAVEFAADDGTAYFLADGREHRVRDLSHAATRGMQDAPGDGTVTAPLNGRVVAVEVAPGARVAKGAVLAVLESMKMEHRIASPIYGVVETVDMRVGQQVAPGEVIARVTPRAMLP